MRVSAVEVHFQQIIQQLQTKFETLEREKVELDTEIGTHKVAVSSMKYYTLLNQYPHCFAG